MTEPTEQNLKLQISNSENVVPREDASQGAHGHADQFGKRNPSCEQKLPTSEVHRGFVDQYSESGHDHSEKRPRLQNPKLNPNPKSKSSDAYKRNLLVSLPRVRNSSSVLILDSDDEKNPTEREVSTSVSNLNDSKLNSEDVTCSNQNLQSQLIAMDSEGYQKFQNLKKKKKKKQKYATLDDRPRIDTEKLSKDVIAELRALKIHQYHFAQKVLNRTQGTLSDLLNHPKTWENMTAKGKNCWMKILEWMELPVEKKMEMFKDEQSVGEPKMNGEESEPPMILTKVQRKTLATIFEETPNPTDQHQRVIAARLKLDQATVSNQRKFRGYAANSHWYSLVEVSLEKQTCFCFY